MPHQGYQILGGGASAPYEPAQHYIRRQTGSAGTTMTDGETHNLYPDVLQFPIDIAGTSGITSTGTWALDAADVGAFVLNVSSSYAETYKINQIGLGAVTTDLVGAINPQEHYFDIIAGTTTGGSSIYHLTKGSWSTFLRGYSATYCGAQGAQFFHLTGTLPDLDVDTDYVIGFGNGGSQGFSLYAGANFVSSRTITTGGGSVTAGYTSVSSFNGSGYLGTSDGTNHGVGTIVALGIFI